MRRWLGRAVFALFTVLLVASTARGGDLLWLVVDRLPHPPAADGANGLWSVSREPPGGVATVAGDLVSLFRLDTQGTLLAQGTYVAEAPLSALVVDDVDLDGRWEVISARGEEGALTVDRWVQGQRLPLGATRYAWGPVEDLRVVSTRSGKLVVAVGQAGGLLTYLAGGRGLEPAGTTEPRQRFELYGAADLDGDGQEELVAGAGRSELVVFRWAPGAGWTRWWQNFPWGGIVGAAVGDVDRDGRPELAVLSGERLLYLFGRPAAGSGLALRSQASVLVPPGVAGLTYLPGAGGSLGRGEETPAVLVVYGAEEIRTFTFSAKLELTQVTMAVGAVQGVLPSGLPAPEEGDLWPRLVARRQDGTLESVAAVRSDRVGLCWATPSGERPAAGVVALGGKLYVTVREVSAQLGVGIQWDEGRKLAEAVTPEGRTVQLIPDRLPLADGAEVPEAGRIVVDGGRMLLEARGVERLFPPQGPEAPRLLVSAGGREFPAGFLW